MAAPKACRIALSTLALSIMSFSAMAAQVPAGTALAAKQELVRHNGAEPDSMDVSLFEAHQTNNIISDLYEGLTRVDNNGRVVPGVATSWKQTSPTSWVFTLRKDAKWSNGTPVTAQDFVYSWQRTVNPKTGSKYTILHEFIKNAKPIIAGKMAPSALGIKALNPYTLQIDTEGPTPFLPEMVAMGNMSPMNKAAMDAAGKDFTKPGKMVTNGAYQLQSWVVNSKMELVKNPHYWNAKNVQITKVTYIPVESDETAFKLYQSGQVDWTDRLPAGQYAAIAKKMPNEIKNAPALGLYMLSLNNNDPALKDKRVRQALSMVLDRDILTKRVAGEGQVPAYSVLVNGIAGGTPSRYDWQTWPMDKRVAEAKKLLAEAGYGPGKKPLKLKFLYNTAELHKKIALFVASEWKKKLGVDVAMENQEWKVFLQTRHRGAYQVARNGWIADYNDATTFLDQVRCGSEQNDNNYCNKSVDAKIAEASKLTDQAKRKQLLSEAANIAMQDYPMVPLFQYTWPRVVKTYVGGYSNRNVMDRFATQDLYIKKH